MTSLKPHFEMLTADHARGWASRAGADLGRGDSSLLSRLQGQAVWTDPTTGTLVTGPTLVSMDRGQATARALERATEGRGSIPANWKGPKGQR